MLNQQALLNSANNNQRRPRLSQAWLCLLLILTTLQSGARDIELELQKIAEQTVQQYQLSRLDITLKSTMSDGATISVTNTALHESLTPNSNKNLFQVGSITKSLIASAVVQLIAHRQLNYNTQLSKFFPQYPNWKNITIRQLLNQTSGIYNYVDSFNWWMLTLNPHKIWPPQQLLDMAYDHSLYFTSGSSWHYSNTNYVLLGLIIEKLTQQPIATALPKLLPGLPANLYYVPGNLDTTLAARLVPGHYHDHLSEINTSWLQGSGAIIASSQAIANWYWHLFNQQILKPAELKQLTNWVKMSDGQKLTTYNEFGYGLGIVSMPSPAGVIWFTPGQTPGYISLVAYLPCKNLVIAYTSATNPVQLIGFHRTLLSKIINVVNNNWQDLNNSASPYAQDAVCANNLTTTKYLFPSF